MLKRHFSLFLLSAALLLDGSAAFAGSQAGTVAASATITSYCSLTANALTFPTSAAMDLTTTAVSSSTTLSVNCSVNTPYNIEMGLGNGQSPTVAKRSMTGSGQYMFYSLYQDPGFTQVWGSTINSNTEASSGTGSPQTFTVYGQTFTGYRNTPGNYTDTVQVTLVY